MALTRVLIIGGYGNFGTPISKHLAREKDIQLVIAGRSQNNAHALAQAIESEAEPEVRTIDIGRNLERSLADIKPDIVIHTSGPYQSQDYHVAKACIARGCHYIDLADARSFVAGISKLHDAAKANGVLVCSGASSVPCLTSALIDHYRCQFETLEKVEYGIATAQLTNRGLATTSAVLSYAGKPFTTLIDGRMANVYGWHDLSFRKYQGLGYRPQGNCDIPDLALFPARYPELKTIRFKAGLELTPLHLGLWFLSWGVRLGLLSSLSDYAPWLLKASRLLDPLGNDDSGFYMRLSGKDERGRSKELVFDLVARHGDGLYIPSMPAILMAKKLARGTIRESGTYPCIGFISLEEYLTALNEFEITWTAQQFSMPLGCPVT